MYADVSGAYFYARAVRPVYVKIPPEDSEEGDEGRCGKLVMSMYGIRNAAFSRAEEYNFTLLAEGTAEGRQTHTFSDTLGRTPQVWSAATTLSPGDQRLAWRKPGKP